MTIGRDPIEHELKTWPDFFDAIWNNEKHFELRKDDRGFQAGDTLLLTPEGPFVRACRIC